MKKVDDETIQLAIDRASKTFGCDPLYFGEEGQKELDRQIEIIENEKRQSK